METEENDILVETLSTKERKLISAFRKLPSEGQASVLMHAGKRGKVSAAIYDYRKVRKLHYKGLAVEDISYKLGLTINAVESILSGNYKIADIGY